jgi:hypothetical protein
MTKARSTRGSVGGSDSAATDRRAAHAEATPTKGSGGSVATRGHNQHQNNNSASVETDVEGKRTPDLTLTSFKRSTSSSDTDEEAMLVKRAKKNWSSAAVELGYEVGTIKHSAYVLLAESGPTGMTVASIVGTAQRLSMYSWGQCKTPNNSVTAALSQDDTFVRIAPSTYCLRSQLRGPDGNMPAPRTSSGSHDSGTTGIGVSAHRNAESGSGNSSRQGRNNGKRQSKQELARAESPMHFIVEEPSYSGYDDEDVVNIQVEDSHDRFDPIGEVKRTADALAQECYKRRMDVFGQTVGDDFGSSFHFPPAEIVRPEHSPEAAVAGSCLLYYPTARTHTKNGIPESPLEPSEATHRAVRWKDEAKNLHASHKKRQSSSPITLPTWVLEQYLEEHHQILCDDLVPTP